MTQPARPIADQTSSETLARLLELLHGFDSATLVTRNRNGSLHGRPMVIAEVTDAAVIWFITSVSSAKVEELSDDSRAMVTAQHDASFVCLNGHVELVFDRDRVAELWQPPYQEWFQGPNDPEIVLLRFTPLDAEYWDTKGTRGLRHAFEAARALVTGDRAAAADRGEEPESHAKLRLWDPSAAANPDW